MVRTAKPTPIRWTRIGRALLRGGINLLNMNRPLRRIEFARHHHKRRREVSDGFRVFDNPDSLILVCYKDSPWGFHSGCPTEAPPAFLHAIRAAGIRVLGSSFCLHYAHQMFGHSKRDRADDRALVKECQP
jgi:hypothetical protein